MKTGSGVFTLTGNNAYAGPTTIEQGTLRLGAAGGIPDNGRVHVDGDGTLDLNNFDKTFSRLTGDGQMLLGSAKLTLNVDGGIAINFSGRILGTGSLVKSGDGTLTLDGANAYSGCTTVMAPAGAFAWPVVDGVANQRPANDRGRSGTVGRVVGMVGRPHRCRVAPPRLGETRPRGTSLLTRSGVSAYNGSPDFTPSQLRLEPSNLRAGCAQCPKRSGKVKPRTSPAKPADDRSRTDSERPSLPRDREGTRRLHGSVCDDRASSPRTTPVK